MKLLQLFPLLVSSTICGAPLAVTPCSVDPNKMDHKQVTLHAQIGFTMHGIVALSDSCKGGGQDVAILLPNRGDTPPVSFELDPQALDRLKPFLRPSGGAVIACGVLRGEIRYKTHFRATMEGGGPQGNGYGPRGAFPIALVLQFVDDIHPCK